MTEYLDLKVGMEFLEQNVPSKRPRTVQLTEVHIYASQVKILDGAGHGHSIQMWNKTLSDSARWKLLPGDEVK